MYSTYVQAIHKRNATQKDSSIRSDVQFFFNFSYCFLIISKLIAMNLIKKNCSVYSVANNVGINYCELVDSYLYEGKCIKRCQYDVICSAATQD